jgi:hypothetical protein
MRLIIPNTELPDLKSRDFEAARGVLFWTDLSQESEANLRTRKRAYVIVPVEFSTFVGTSQKPIAVKAEPIPPASSCKIMCWRSVHLPSLRKFQYPPRS